MYKKTVMLLITCSIAMGFSDISYVPKLNITTPSNYLTTDNLGNIYCVNNDVLSKYYSNASLFKTFNNKALGTITYVDATNPMRPLVFYRDFFQIIFLDNTLSANSAVIDLLNFDFKQPQVVCSASNNGIWVFDQLTQELSRLDQTFAITNRSGNLVQTVGRNITPAFITEYNNNVYMSDKEVGILVFDIFGSYKKTIPVKTADPFQVTEEKIYFTSDSTFNSYDLLSFEKEKIELPEKEFSYVRVQDRLLYVGTKDAITVFEIK